MKRVYEDIYQIVSPFPEFQRKEAYQFRQDLEANPRVTKGLPYVLLYYTVSKGETMLVDCGWNTDDALLALQEQLRDIGSDVTDVRQLLLTHAHPDHCGLGGRLKELAGCTVHLHELEAAFLGSRYDAPEELLRRMDGWLAQNGVPEEERTELERASMPMRFFVAHLEPDQRLKGGEVIQVGDFVFEVIWTPGHAPGHVCLYEPNHRLLLSGDHVLPTITPNVSLHPQQRENPLQDYLDSLEKVASLKVDKMLPAHEWDIDWFQKRIQQMSGHHLGRLEDMLEAVGKNGAASAADVARRLRWTTGNYESFPPFMKRAAIGEALAHLRFLAREGRLIEQEEDGVLLFQSA